MRISGLHGRPSDIKPMYANIGEAKAYPALTLFDSGRVLWARSPRQRARTEPRIMRDMHERPLYRINVKLK